MSALTFELKGRPDQRLDLSPLIPAKLNDLKPKDIEALAIGTTRVKLSVGDVREIRRRYAIGDVSYDALGREFRRRR